MSRIPSRTKHAWNYYRSQRFRCYQATLFSSSNVPGGIRGAAGKSKSFETISSPFTRLCVCAEGVSALDLWLPEAGVEDELVLLAPAAKDRFYLLIVALWEDGDIVFSDRWSVQALATRLASGCSALGWFHEAEVLFIVLRTGVKGYHFLSPSAARIAVQYCLHLESEKRYGEILSILHDTYTNLISNPYDTDGQLEGTQPSPEEQPRYFLTMGNIMNRIPRPLNQHISSGKVNQLAALENLFDEERRRFECEESEDSGESVVTEDDEVDCESSNKFGVTYTESVITGISFNYSDLYR
ncbi:hypothetical protein F5882DRAFT_478980 [Hyaloscypha sp. PMI_1271]|nr:hypothetical protein F5882DRAFT_478980 [Hyaloscypha sp. PMI_1271]